MWLIIRTIHIQIGKYHLLPKLVVQKYCVKWMQDNKQAFQAAKSNLILPRMWVYITIESIKMQI